MIEFTGYLSGMAEKQFHKRGRRLVQSVLIASLLLLLPVFIVFAIRTRFWPLLIAYGCMFLLSPILTRIPQHTKDLRGFTPKRLFTEDEYIVCIADKYVEYRLIEDVKTVYEYNDFYELVFPFGKVSEKFICQKDLLTKGTLEEFEALFGEKIQKRVEKPISPEST